METTDTAPSRTIQWLKILRGVVAGSAILIGAFVVMATATLGHCSAFGGRCPRPNTFDGEIFGGAAIGMALAVGVPMWMHRPTLRGLLRAVVVATLVALPVGVLVMASTQGG